VTMKPPVVPVNGVWGAFSWLKVVICTSDVWLLHSAGLDALVLQKSHALGIQIFLPVAILGCCMREYVSQARASQIHASGGLGCQGRALDGRIQCGSTSAQPHQCLQVASDIVMMHVARMCEAHLNCVIWPCHGVLSTNNPRQ
jgi:hypothetical protein